MLIKVYKNRKPRKTRRSPLSQDQIIKFDTKRAVDAPTHTSIRALRKLLGLTQGRFAAQLDVVLMCVYQWEHRIRVPNRFYAAKLRQLATMNGVAIDLLDQEGYFKSCQTQIYTERENIFA